ncbi:hypothetical protein Lspi_0215 [Legionella spiritensis]|uniref:Uncharacterized protein n=1 Tax=Legionella spiritensis TaxID=452 RepID=A0A0W0ZAM2_LEGSP|nr:hypothetical protein Lspi_0215 [Legionella spiritensis]
MRDNGYPCTHLPPATILGQETRNTAAGLLTGYCFFAKNSARNMLFTKQWNTMGNSNHRCNQYIRSNMFHYDLIEAIKDFCYNIVHIINPGNK